MGPASRTGREQQGPPPPLMDHNPFNPYSQEQQRYQQQQQQNPYFQVQNFYAVETIIQLSLDLGFLDLAHSLDLEH